jgi:ring-1,2-phenylacetyl-CoA epoxidase subunit PaaD
MTAKEIFKILERVTDPEIPVLTIEDLGILKDVSLSDDGTVIVTITPTYNGCPAMDMIRVHIKSALQDSGYHQVEIITVLEPAWTTDWITAAGRQKMMEYGIAPPAENSHDLSFTHGNLPTVQCPQCHSSDTVMVSRFGSTACKALYKCNACLEPFDYFKCH